MAKTKNILNFKQLKKISKETSLINNDGPFLVKYTPFLNQIIRPSNQEESNLYNKSKSLILFREHVFIRAKTKQGIKFDSKILKGSFNKFKNIKQLEREIQKLDFLVRKNSLSLVEFQIIHTHPTGCYLDKKVLSLGGISKSDVHVANHFFEKFKTKISIKAICPGNITFCSA